MVWAGHLLSLATSGRSFNATGEAAACGGATVSLRAVEVDGADVTMPRVSSVDNFTTLDCTALLV